MRIKTLFVILVLINVKRTFAVRCDTNPCQLNDYFKPPRYYCIQLPNNLNDVICTCPNGEWRQNAPCRICNNVNCGPGGVCIEQQFFQGAFYACGCTDSIGYYVKNGTCPNAITTTTTTVAPTSPPLNCRNGGVYNPSAHTCICPPAFTGLQCETSIGQDLCQRITCVNKGVCNPVPTANNGVDVQCWCIDGYSGSNCELKGTPGRCSSNLCQNGGVCEERRLGASLYAYCRCQPGFNGQCCENHYFTCPSSGLYVDTKNCKFGRYFECVGTFATTRSCEKGFRFNDMKMKCDIDGYCP